MASASQALMSDAMKSSQPPGYFPLQQPERDAVTRIVDLVVTGADTPALALAVDAVRHGRRVLVVLRSGDARVVRRFCRDLCRAANGSQLMVMTNAEVVCVDGVDSVEAVVIRHSRTRRLCP